jgi:hypothetical protein
VVRCATAARGPAALLDNDVLVAEPVLPAATGGTPRRAGGSSGDPRS